MHIVPRQSDQYFTVSVYKDKITVSWRLDMQNQGTLSFGKIEADGNWTSIVLRLNNNSMECGYANSNDENASYVSTNFSFSLWYDLLVTGTVTLGGLGTTFSDRHSYVTVGSDKQILENRNGIQENSIDFTERALTTASPLQNTMSGNLRDRSTPMIYAYRTHEKYNRKITCNCKFNKRRNSYNRFVGR